MMEYMKKKSSTRDYPRCFSHMVGKTVARKRQLLKFVPGVMKCETMLYIGANPRRFELMDLFWAEAPQMFVDVLEAWAKNVDGLNRLNAKYKIFNNILHGDVREVPNFFINNFAGESLDMYDVVMFWHGPEHLEIDEIPSVLHGLEFLAKKYVILGCPWGNFPQKDVGGNPFEEHKSVLYPADFAEYGYETRTIKKPDKRGGHILAWKEMA
jgi:hypothetical protein